MVLPDIDTDGAVTIAETIRTGILDLGIRHDAGTSGRLTVSIGVTTSYPEHDDDMQGALKLADDALYRAKEGGRNRVVVHPAASGGLAARRPERPDTPRRRAMAEQGPDGRRRRPCAKSPTMSPRPAAARLTHRPARAGARLLRTTMRLKAKIFLLAIVPFLLAIAGIGFGVRQQSDVPRAHAARDDPEPRTCRARKSS